MIKKLMKLLSYFGVFGNNVSIHGLNFSAVRESKALQDFYLNHNFEVEMFKLIQGFGYQSFLDLGAYFGYFSTFAKAKAGIENVIAYEADPDNFSKLTQFANDNGAAIKAVNKAVGDTSGEIDFYKPVYKGTTKYPAHGQIGNPNTEAGNLYAGKAYKKLTVPMAPIAAVVAENVKGQTLIKLDIEGYEERCLRSIQSFLTGTGNVDFLVEVMINDLNKEAIFSFFKECGYDAYLLTNAGLIAEDRPLTLPKPHTDPAEDKLRTIWKNHFFTKRSPESIKALNLKVFGYHI